MKMFNKLNHDAYLSRRDEDAALLQKVLNSHDVFCGEVEVHQILFREEPPTYLIRLLALGAHESVTVKAVNRICEALFDLLTVEIQIELFVARRDMICKYPPPDEHETSSR